MMVVLAVQYQEDRVQTAEVQVGARIPALPYRNGLFVSVPRLVLCSI
jgi:hypothetical protein